MDIISTKKYNATSTETPRAPLMTESNEPQTDRTLVSSHNRSYQFNQNSKGVRSFIQTLQTLQVQSYANSASFSPKKLSNSTVAFMQDENYSNDMQNENKGLFDKILNEGPSQKQPQTIKDQQNEHFQKRINQQIYKEQNPEEKFDIGDNPQLEKPIWCFGNLDRQEWLSKIEIQSEIERIKREYPYDYIQDEEQYSFQQSHQHKGHTSEQSDIRKIQIKLPEKNTYKQDQTVQNFDKKTQLKQKVDKKQIIKRKINRLKKPKKHLKQSSFKLGQQSMQNQMSQQYKQIRLSLPLQAQKLQKSQRSYQPQQISGPSQPFLSKESQLSKRQKTQKRQKRQKRQEQKRPTRKPKEPKQIKEPKVPKQKKIKKQRHIKKQRKQSDKQRADTQNASTLSIKIFNHQYLPLKKQQIVIPDSLMKEQMTLVRDKIFQQIQTLYKLPSKKKKYIKVWQIKILFQYHTSNYQNFLIQWTQNEIIKRKIKASKNKKSITKSQQKLQNTICQQEGQIQQGPKQKQINRKGKQILRARFIEKFKNYSYTSINATIDLIKAKMIELFPSSHITYLFKEKQRLNHGSKQVRIKTQCNLRYIIQELKAERNFPSKTPNNVSDRIAQQQELI